MKLFHETENKYYELITYLINCHESFTDKDLENMLNERIIGEIDFEVIDTLFSKKTDGEMVFRYQNKTFSAIMNEKMPVRNTAIELQAAKSLVYSKYSRDFLCKQTCEKLDKATEKIDSGWCEESICVKNQYLSGDINGSKSYEEELRIIHKAICESSAIYYDNIKQGYFEYKHKKAFPIKIEYSLLNDRYRVCVYDPLEQRFIKINLCTMSNIQQGKEIMEGLWKMYTEFLEKNTKKLVLDIEDITRGLERCFRIFSYYDKKAIYDKENNQYQLEINYLEFDKKEIIRDILALGSYVIVREPKTIQTEVYSRIQKTLQRYQDNL